MIAGQWLGDFIGVAEGASRFDADGWDATVVEKQRVAITRTLLKNPSVLIFDEATSALDSAHARTTHDELREAARVPRCSPRGGRHAGRLRLQPSRESSEMKAARSAVSA